MKNKQLQLHQITKELIPDGSTIAIGGVHSHNVPMALVRQLIRIGSRDLTIIASISAGLPIDLLVGAGCVKKVLSPYVGFEMWGLAPNFRRAVEHNTIEAPEVCEAFPVYSLRASSNGLLFHPFPQGIHEFSDIHKQSELYKQVMDPFTGEKVWAIAAITPDIAILHVQEAAEDGNCVHKGSVVTDRLMATAAKTVIVSCDELVSLNTVRDNPSNTTIPGFFVDHVIHQPKGAFPTSSHGNYDYDELAIVNYLQFSKSAENYSSYLKDIHLEESKFIEKYLCMEPKKETLSHDLREPYSINELIAVLFARDIKDDEIGICGAVSDIPMAAMQLAEKLQAPGLRWIAGGSGYVNPRGYLVPSSTDYQMHYQADARLSMDDVIAIEMEEIDFFFAGGLQIDAHGNCNLAGIPSEDGWKLRGPGSVGLAFLPRAGRSYLYTTTHNARTLVEKVAYVSGPGHPEEGNPYGGGPSMLVTNLCVFVWNKSNFKWQLLTLHPDVTVDQVKEQTGFDFDYNENTPVTRIPTERELKLLREIDVYGYLRK